VTVARMRADDEICFEGLPSDSVFLRESFGHLFFPPFLESTEGHVLLGVN
jgi:hypothetical protein